MAACLLSNGPVAPPSHNLWPAIVKSTLEAKDPWCSCSRSKDTLVVRVDRLVSFSSNP